MIEEVKFATKSNINIEIFRDYNYTAAGHTYLPCLWSVDGTAPTNSTIMVSSRKPESYRKSSPSPLRAPRHTPCLGQALNENEAKTRGVRITYATRSTHDAMQRTLQTLPVHDRTISLDIMWHRSRPRVSPSQPGGALPLRLR